MIDKTELFQKELEGLDLDDTKMEKEYLSLEEIDKNLFLEENIEIPTMDKHVKIISTPIKETIIYPLKKKVNIKTKEFKTKGILSKKKNILSTYEDQEETNKIIEKE